MRSSTCDNTHAHTGTQTNQWMRDSTRHFPATIGKDWHRTHRHTCWGREFLTASSIASDSHGTWLSKETLLVPDVPVPLPRLELLADWVVGTSCQSSRDILFLISDQCTRAMLLSSALKPDSVVAHKNATGVKRHQCHVTPRRVQRGLPPPPSLPA